MSGLVASVEAVREDRGGVGCVKVPGLTSEDGAGWPAFWRDLTARGLTGVKLVVPTGLDR